MCRRENLQIKQLAGTVYYTHTRGGPHVDCAVYTVAGPHITYISPCSQWFPRTRLRVLHCAFPAGPHTASDPKPANSGIHHASPCLFPGLVCAAAFPSDNFAFHTHPHIRRNPTTINSKHLCKTTAHFTAARIFCAVKARGCDGGPCRCENFVAFRIFCDVRGHTGLRTAHPAHRPLIVVNP